MRIKTLRASGLRVQADVVIGSADNGSLVTTHVVIERAKNDDLEAALIPLENLLLRTAEERTGQAKTNAAIDARVNERLAKVIESEKERLAKNHDTTVKEAIRVEEGRRERVERDLRDTQRRLQEVDESNARWRQRVDTLESELVQLRANQSQEATS